MTDHSELNPPPAGHNEPTTDRAIVVDEPPTTPQVDVVEIEELTLDQARARRRHREEARNRPIMLPSVAFLDENGNAHGAHDVNAWRARGAMRWTMFKAFHCGSCGHDIAPLVGGRRLTRHDLDKPVEGVEGHLRFPPLNAGCLREGCECVGFVPYPSQHQ